MSFRVFVDRATNVAKDLNAFGWSVVFHRIVGFVQRQRLCTVNVRDYGAFTFRARGTDLYVMRQVFRDRDYDLATFRQWSRIQQAYDQMRKRGQLPIIIDAGANIGASARYFASTFPHAHVIAVEPQHENAELCRKNTALNQNVTVVEAALGSTSGFAEITNPRTAAWGFRTERSVDGGIPVVTIADLVDMFDNGALLIVKIDIEGFEDDVFAENTRWLDDLPSLIIEPHDFMLDSARSSRSFQRAIASRDFDILLSGENLVYFRSGIAS